MFFCVPVYHKTTGMLVVHTWVISLQWQNCLYIHLCVCVYVYMLVWVYCLLWSEGSLLNFLVILYLWPRQGEGCQEPLPPPQRISEYIIIDYKTYLRKPTWALEFYIDIWLQAASFGCFNRNICQRHFLSRTITHKWVGVGIKWVWPHNFFWHALDCIWCSNHLTKILAMSLYTTCWLNTFTVQI